MYALLLDFRINSPPTPAKTYILLPAYSDWETKAILLRQAVCCPFGGGYMVLLVYCPVPICEHKINCSCVPNYGRPGLFIANNH